MVHIRVINETDEFQNIIVFQQDDESGLMFDKVFPLPWQLFPLPGKTEGVEREGTAEYSFSQQIGVTRDNEASLALLDKVISFGRLIGEDYGIGRVMRRFGFRAKTAVAAKRDNAVREPSGGLPVPLFTDGDDMERLMSLASVVAGKLAIKIRALNGDRFDYSLDEKGGQYIVRLDERNKDGSISCRNKSESLVNVDFYRNETRVAVWPALANGDEARFLLKRNISFSYGNDFKSGDMIRTRIGGDRAATVELAGYSMIEARLVYDPDSPGRKKKWIIVKN